MGFSGLGQKELRLPSGQLIPKVGNKTRRFSLAVVNRHLQQASKKARTQVSKQDTPRAHLLLRSAVRGYDGKG